MDFLLFKCLSMEQYAVFRHLFHSPAGNSELFNFLELIRPRIYVGSASGGLIWIKYVYNHVSRTLIRMLQSLSNPERWKARPLSPDSRTRCRPRAPTPECRHRTAAARAPAATAQRRLPAAGSSGCGAAA